MKGLFIPEITAEMFRNGCLESIEALMAEGEIYDIDYETERKKGKWIEHDNWYGVYYECSVCKEPFTLIDGTPQDNLYNFCPNCGADMRGNDAD